LGFDVGGGFDSVEGQAAFELFLDLPKQGQNAAPLLSYAFL